MVEHDTRAEQRAGVPRGIAAASPVTMSIRPQWWRLGRSRNAIARWFGIARRWRRAPTRSW
jgi:hypothetical protein